jgi:acetyl esterase/lipase
MSCFREIAMPRRRTLAALLLAPLASACAPLALINGLTPTDTFRRETALAYGALERQKLDLYIPASGATPAPVVVFFFGGSWRSGSRGDYLFVGEALAARGFVAVVADYRLYPEVRYPDFVADSALAVRWVSENVARSGGDPERLFLMGHSAGAYNAAMLAFDEQYLGRAGVRPRAVRGFVGLAGPYDFLPLTSRLLQNVFGYPDTSPSTQPINAVRAGAPPVLLLTARNDVIVSPGNSARLAARLRSVGGRVREIGYDGLDHGTLLGALAVPLRDRAPVLDDLAGFVRDEAG